MSYNPSIPQANDNLSVSQPELLTNFTQLNTQFGEDHSPFYTGSGNGTGHHTKMTIDTPLSSVSPTSTQGIYWTKAISGVTQGMFSNASASYQLTGQSTTNDQNGGTGIPSGIQFRWGAVAANTGSTTFTYTTAMSTATLNVQLTANGSAPSSAAYWVSSYSSTGFTVQNNTGFGIGFGYFATGY